MTTSTTRQTGTGRNLVAEGLAWLAAVARRASTLDLRSLAVFRVLLGTILVADALMRTPDASLTLTPDGILPPDLVRRFVGHPWSWSVGLACDAPWWGHGLLVAEGVCGLLLAAGVGLPLTTTAAWIVAVSVVRRTAPVTNAGDVFLVVLLFWSQFLPLGDRLSAGAVWRSTRREPANDRCGGIAALALTLQVAAVYLSAGGAKWNPVWWSGEAVGYALSVHDHGTSLGDAIAGWPWLARCSTWAALLLELAGPPLLLVPRLRIPLIGVFVLFHLAIAATMDVCLFPWVGIAAWIALLPASFWEWIGAPGSGVPVGTTRNHQLDRPRQMLCAGALAVGVVAFVLANGPWPPERLPTWVTRAVQLTFLEQDWRVFGEIRPQRQWVYGRAELADGEVVDLLRDGRPLETVLPAGGFHSIGNQRLQKLFWELPKPAHRAFAPSIAAALARRWNSAHPPGRQVVALEVHGARMVTAPEAGTIQDVLLATWPPRTASGEGNLERFLREREPSPVDPEREDADRASEGAGR
jgi:hypothetical protein